MKKQTINALLVGAMIFGTVMLQSCSSQNETTETTVTKSVASDTNRHGERYLHATTRQHDDYDHYHQIVVR